MDKNKVRYTQFDVHLPCSVKCCFLNDSSRKPRRNVLRKLVLHQTSHKRCQNKNQTAFCPEYKNEWNKPYVCGSFRTYFLALGFLTNSFAVKTLKKNGTNRGLCHWYLQTDETDHLLQNKSIRTHIQHLGR